MKTINSSRTRLVVLAIILLAVGFALFWKSQQPVVYEVEDMQQCFGEIRTAANSSTHERIVKKSGEAAFLRQMAQENRCVTKRP